MAGEASPRSAGGCGMRNTLELVDVDSDRLEDVLRRAEQALDEKDAELIRAVFDSYAYVTELVEDKSTTIRRLRNCSSGRARKGPTPWWVRRPRRPMPLDRAMPTWLAALGTPTNRTRRPPRRVTGGTAPRPIEVPSGSTCRTRRSVRAMPAPPAARG